MGTEKHQRILEAATEVFLRYGFRRTTMGDLAAAAGVSRPALYLLYCNKERIFEEALARMVERTLGEVKARIAQPGTPGEKLRFAFECWVVRPFTMLQGSPDARDLVQGDLPFLADLKARWSTAFEGLLMEILAAIPGPRPAGAEPLDRVARVLAVSGHGFKEAAHSLEELRSMVETLLRVTEASLAPPQAPVQG